MDITTLAFCAGVEEYQIKATELLDALGSGDPNAIQLIRQRHPRLTERANANGRDQLTDPEIRSVDVSLADAQRIVARCYGFESWPELAAFAEAVSNRGSATWQFESAVEAIISGDVATLESLLRGNPELVRARSLREHGATLLLYVAPTWSRLTDKSRRRMPSKSRRSCSTPAPKSMRPRKRVDAARRWARWRRASTRPGPVRKSHSLTLC